MKCMLAALMLGALALPAQAQTTIDDAYLVQVQPGPKRYFYDEYEDGCPALTAKCRHAAYVVAGDLLVASEAKGAFTNVRFVNARGRASWGWIETAGLKRLDPPPPGPGAWLGDWRWAESDIEISATRRAGRLAVHGDATWGSFDPERVKRGGINTGEMEGAITVAGGRITAASGDVVLGPLSEAPGDCNVRLRMLGPYLVAQDNSGCGGHNVTFSGVYRKTR
jgi:hypothetical protein